MAVDRFFLCCPDCPKQPRTSFTFHKFFYTTISCRISAYYRMHLEQPVMFTFLFYWLRSVPKPHPCQLTVLKPIPYQVKPFFKSHSLITVINLVSNAHCPRGLFIGIILSLYTFLCILKFSSD